VKSKGFECGVLECEKLELKVVFKLKKTWLTVVF
jgi:hypothetical protein